MPISRLRGAGTSAESGEGTPVLCASEIVETDRTVTDIQYVTVTVTVYLSRGTATRNQDLGSHITGVSQVVSSGSARVAGGGLWRDPIALKVKV